MRHWILGLLLCIANPFVARAEPFERAEVTKAINVVALLPRNIKAVPGDVVSGDSALKTGDNSRAELEFPDLTITRVGSNALFRFLAGRREMTLDGGTMLFSSPEGAGGGKVQAGAITAAVTGTDFLISYIENPGKGQGNLPERQGPGLFYGKSQDARCADARADGRYPSRGHENAAHHDDQSRGPYLHVHPYQNGTASEPADLERNASNQQASLLARFFPGVNDLLTQTGNQRPRS